MYMFAASGERRTGQPPRRRSKAEGLGSRRSKGKPKV